MLEKSTSSMLVPVLYPNFFYSKEFLVSIATDAAIYVFVYLGQKGGHSNSVTEGYSETAE